MINMEIEWFIENIMMMMIENKDLSAPDYPGAINNPDDNPQKGKTPTDAHYELTNKMLEKFIKLIKE